MEIQTAIEIINNIIKNKKYNEIIHEYINTLLQSNCIISEQNGEIIISNTNFDEYVSIQINGPEVIMIDFQYCSKKDNYKYHLTFTNIEEEIEVLSLEEDKNKVTSVQERYKDNNLKYFVSYETQGEKEIIKEMFINDKNICFTSIEELENDKTINEENYVNKVNSPYVFNTLENDTEFEIEIISDITIKQYIKATKYELKKERKKAKERTRKNKNHI